jgi:microcin C transport system permease protein
VQHLIEAKGWMLWPLLPYDYGTRASGSERSNALLAPSLRHPLGTDDQARDVLARVIYGFRISCCSASR